METERPPLSNLEVWHECLTVCPAYRETSWRPLPEVACEYTALRRQNREEMGDPLGEQRFETRRRGRNQDRVEAACEPFAARVLCVRDGIRVAE